MQHLLIEHSSQHTREQRGDQHERTDRERSKEREEDHHARNAHPDQCKAIKHQRRHEHRRDKQQVRKKHLHAIALGQFLGRFESVHRFHIRLVEQNVRHRTVFIGAHGGKHSARARDQSPNEDPKLLPRHADQHALQGLSVLRNAQHIARTEHVPAQGTQIHPRKRRRQQHADRKPDGGHARKQRHAEIRQKRREHCQREHAERLLHQCLERTTHQCENHMVPLLHFLFLLYRCKRWLSTKEPPVLVKTGGSCVTY